jgi:hypothetical protein
MDTKPSYPDSPDPNSFESGLEFQDFVAELLLKETGIPLMNYSSRKYQFKVGENKQGIEIKLDRRMGKNVSIEVAEKSRQSRTEWTNSGIFRNDNSWLYIQGNYKKVFVFGVTILRLAYQKDFHDKTWEPYPTIRTFLMPIDYAERIALKVFDLEAKS